MTNAILKNCSLNKTKMKKIFLIFFSLALLHTSVFSQNYLCESSFLFCTDSVNDYPAGVNAGTAQSGADYTCLGTQVNPAWYFMEVLNSGPINIYMSSLPQVDIDFSIWGPFTDQTTPCVAQLTANNTVDCSYSTSWNETANIPDAQAGQIYILLICNYSNQVCNINFLQQNAGQPGAGALNCLAMPQIYYDGHVCEGETLNLMTQSFPAGYNYYWTGPNGFVSTQQNPVIDNVTQANEGAYFLQIINGTDTSDISTETIEILPLPLVDLGNDFVLCNYTTYVLNAGSGFNYYIWNTDTFSQTIAYTQTIPVSASTYGIGTRQFWVKVGGYNGCVNTDSILVTFQDCSGIEELPSNDIKIFPNPAFNAVQIVLPDDFIGNKHIQMLDISGKEIISENVFNNNITLNTKNLSGGIYYIKVTNNDKCYIKELLIK